MSNLAIKRLSPHYALKDYIKNIWVFKSNGQLTEEEMRIIAPNGSVKLILYDEGHLAGRIGEHTFLVPENRLFVAGVSDCPTFAEFNRDKPFRCISFELNPIAAYRLFDVPQHELRNIMVSFSELIGASANRILEERIYLATNMAHKADLLQEYLTGVITRTERDATFEHGATLIMNTRGLTSMASFSQEIGYSDRWLRTKFAERLGISPKTFASIIRFQSCYQALLSDKRVFMQGKHFIDRYYDQAHFIKEFKRFMGHSPVRYLAKQNEVGEIIYDNKIALAPFEN